MAMRVRVEEDDQVEIQMAPLIDCMFLLLIFFLVATTLKKMVREVPLELPYAEAAVEVPEEPDLLVIGLDSYGQLYINGTLSGRQQVIDQIHTAKLESRPVRLDADKTATYESVLEIIELCNIQGISDVGLHTLDPRSVR